MCIICSTIAKAIVSYVYVIHFCTICKHSRYSAHEQLNRERNDPDRCLDGPAAGAYISLQFVESKQSDLQWYKDGSICLRMQHGVSPIVKRRHNNNNNKKRGAQWELSEERWGFIGEKEKREYKKLGEIYYSFLCLFFLFFFPPVGSFLLLLFFFSPATWSIRVSKDAAALLHFPLVLSGARQQTREK